MKRRKFEGTGTAFDERKIRDESVERFEVLDKVKQLLMISELNCMTTKQVADYYEVGKEAIEAIYTRHSDELSSDGMRLCKRGELLNLQYESLENKRGKSIMLLHNNIKIEIPNRGLKVFPRRAILRIGMLLRDSSVAKEVRSQLLNMEEKATQETKIIDINEEQQLMLSVGMAYASGNIEAVMKATTEYNSWQNRHIEKLKSDCKALAGEILNWEDRNKLNAGLRKLASVTGVQFGMLWNELYRNLQYKYRISLKQRGDKPYIQWINESEWRNVMKTFCAMCEAYSQSPTEMFQQTELIVSA